MTPSSQIAFLPDVDDTLLDNDRIIADFGAHLAHEFDGENRDRPRNFAGYTATDPTLERIGELVNVVFPALPGAADAGRAQQEEP